MRRVFASQREIPPGPVLFKYDLYKRCIVLSADMCGPRLTANLNSSEGCKLKLENP